MRLLLFLPVLITAIPSADINFGGSSNNNQNNNIDIGNRQHSGNNNNHLAHNQCCCVPSHQSCSDTLEQPITDDLVGEGLINERIVIRPPGSENLKCSYGSKLCCYEFDYSVFGRTCVAPSAGGSGKQTQSSSGGGYNEEWRQGCKENSVYGSNQCGRRNYNGPAKNIGYGESSPGEFPWTCLILNDNNDFLGSCAIVPESSNNDVRRGTRKVITVAHNINKLASNLKLKVRVGEYNAAGYQSPEKYQHVEYSVKRRVIHPEFDSKRLNNDIAVLMLTQSINLNHQYVNPACYPCGDNQFDHQFNNGTGVRCWVAGWGKDEFDGSYQVNQHKVDLPLVSNYKCQNSLKEALNNQKRGVGGRFQLDQGEICAGGEANKDACTGDGGGPLVCQAKSGRWTVVGLVSWGIGCATEVPGIYTRVSTYQKWISQIY